MSQTILLVVAVVAVAWFALNMSGPDLAGAEARQIVADGGHLLDVRTTSEFAAGHIPGATNISVAQLGKRLDELPAKDRPLVVYCRSGARSGRAQRILRKAGFTSVKNLGAMSNW